MPASELEREVSLSQAAYERIASMIVSGELAGGTVVNDRRLSELLGFSRTPVREALGRLEGEGMLRRSGRTILVNAVDLGAVLEILGVRRALEAEAARLAAGHMERALIDDLRRSILELGDIGRVSPEAHWRLDDRLHLGIAEAGGNRLMCQMIQDLRKRTAMFGMRQIPERFEPGKQEHLAILDALSAGDGEAAGTAMATHIDGAREAIIHAVTRGRGR